MAVRRPKTKNPLSPLDVLAVSGPKKAKAPAAPKAAKAPKDAKAPKAPALTLDYPLSGEQVRPGHYAIRVAAKPELTVEVAIDGGEWQPCRESVGYYWFDWAPTASGTHTIVARAKNGSPRFAKSEERTCVVVETPASN